FAGRGRTLARATERGTLAFPPFEDEVFERVLYRRGDLARDGAREGRELAGDVAVNLADRHAVPEEVGELLHLLRGGAELLRLPRVGGAERRPRPVPLGGGLLRELRPAEIGLVGRAEIAAHRVEPAARGVESDCSVEARRGH